MSTRALSPAARLFIALLAAGCAKDALSPTTARVTHNAPLSTIVMPLGALTSVDTVFGPSLFRRQVGMPATATATFGVADIGVYETSATLIVLNGRADGSARVHSGSISLNGAPLLGPSDLATSGHELRVQVPLLEANKLEVTLLAAPDAEIEIRLEASLKPGYGRVGNDGGTLVSSDGLVTASLAPGLHGGYRASLQRVDPMGSVPNASRASETYEFQIWSGSPQQPAALGIPALRSPSASARSATSLASSIVPSPFWTDQTNVQLTLNTAAAPTEQYFATTAVSGFENAGTTAAITTQTVADKVVANFVGVVDGYAQKFTAWKTSITDCSDQYRLIPAAPSPKVPIIWIHGFQIEYPVCVVWKYGLPGALAAFDPMEQGTTFYGNWDASLLSSASLYRFTYPTFASVDAAGSRLADELKTYVNPSNPAVLVAHSMGGLVARSAVELHGAAPYVRAIITLGTPHQGSPLASPGYIVDAARRSGVLADCAIAVASGCPVAFEVGTTLLDDALKTDGARDLQPSSAFLSRLVLRPDVHYSFAFGEWGTFLSLNEFPCWMYGDKLCAAAFVGERAMSINGAGFSDGIVPVLSAQNNGIRNFNDPLAVTLSVAPAHHFALASGAPKGAVPDGLFDLVVKTLRLDIGLCPSFFTCFNLAAPSPNAGELAVPADRANFFGVRRSVSFVSSADSARSAALRGRR